ncbi:hypothetical protein BDR05DRAFT_966078 [Suillus weaverae]|nr:hypothetical protein BDR05DRAFT_966078 [Suillus weaverae]
MHLCFLYVFYQPVDAGLYSEDDVAPFSVLCSAHRLYLWCNDEQPHFPDPHTKLYLLLEVSSGVHKFGLSFTVTEAVGDVHEAFFDSYNVGTMYAGIAHSLRSCKLCRRSM